MVAVLGSVAVFAGWFVVSYDFVYLLVLDVGMVAALGVVAVDIFDYAWVLVWLLWVLLWVWRACFVCIWISICVALLGLACCLWSNGFS